MTGTSLAAKKERHAHGAREHEGTEVREIFSSATVRDMNHERYPCRGLARSSLEKAEIAVFVQEHWAAPYANVVDECRRRVNACSGYLALLGYGWVPRGDAGACRQGALRSIATDHVVVVENRDADALAKVEAI